MTIFCPRCFGTEFLSFNSKHYCASGAFKRQMTAPSFLHRKPVRFLLLFYLLMLVIVWFNDNAILDLANVAKGWYVQRFSRRVSDEQYHKAFHLTEKRSPDAKVILFWNPPFGHVYRIGAEENGCIQTYDRSAIASADAVVFHFAEVNGNGNNLPFDKRTPDQRWIWFCMESPWSTRFVFWKELTPLKGVFNWTMTYRRDSDVYAKYTIYNYEPKRTNKTIKELIAEKTAKLPAMWIVTNCKSSVRRNFVNNLKKFIGIEMMGKCFNNPICYGDCMLSVINKYKFYLAFENSRCKDYITEKFWWNGLSGGAVPVVMGAKREDYEKIAPPKSFIHVSDFASERELADYLLMLDRNDTAYGEFLRWKSIPDSADTEPPTPATVPENSENLIHSLCEKLKKSDAKKAETVKDLDTWWYGKGYTSASKTFEHCSATDGPSAPSYSRHITLFYSFVILVFLLISIRIEEYLRRRRQ